MCGVRGERADWFTEHFKPQRRWATLAVTKTQETEATSQQPHQNWTKEDVARSDVSPEFEFRKQHEGLAPSCLVALVQAGGGGIIVWGVIVSLFHACPFMTTVDHILMVNSSRMVHHVTNVLWKHALRSKVRSSFYHHNK